MIINFGCKDKLIEEYESGFEFKIISGDGQSGVFNEPLPEPITVEVIHPDGSRADGYKILASSEFGEFVEDFKTTEDGIATFEWELGCGEEQDAIFWLYGTECNSFTINTGACSPYDSVATSATAIQEIGWIQGCGIDSDGIYQAQFEQTDYAQYILMNGIVYTSTDNGLSWKDLAPLFIQSQSIHILDITLDPSDKSLHAVLSNNTKVRLSEPDQSWTDFTSIGEVEIGTELGGFIIHDNNTFASFGRDGIFILENNEWKVVSQALDAGEQIHSFGIFTTLDIVIGLIESDGEAELILSDNDSFTSWTRTEIGPNYFSPPFGDFLVLSDLSFAFGSGVSCRLVEITPNGEFIDEYINNNSLNGTIGKSIKDLNFHEGEIYFLGFDKNFINTTGKIYKGLEGDFDEVDFDLPCNNVTFFDIRDDGSFIVGCDDGFYVFKE